MPTRMASRAWRWRRLWTLMPSQCAKNGPCCCRFVEMRRMPSCSNFRQTSRQAWAEAIPLSSRTPKPVLDKDFWTRLWRGLAAGWHGTDSRRHERRSTHFQVLRGKARTVQRGRLPRGRGGHLVFSCWGTGTSRLLVNPPQVF